MEKSLFEKVFASQVSKMVRERLGTLKKSIFEEVEKNLTDDEKFELGKCLIDLIEQACKEFVADMRQRLEEWRKKTA